MSEFSDRSVIRVLVKDLPLLAYIGINSDEIESRQPLVITVVLTLRSSSVSEVSETIDYRRIASEAEDLATHHVPLIETFAQKLGERCLRMRGARSVRVSVDKPFAIVRGLAGTEVEMHNSDVKDLSE